MLTRLHELCYVTQNALFILISMTQATRQRHERIMAILLDRQHVTVGELATNMLVSEATVRRDLRMLADEHQLTLVHGGATLPREGDFSFHAKRTRNVDAKRTVGQLAASLVHDGDQIFLDSGTTCFEMAPHLLAKRGVNVIVNSARLTLELKSTSLNVIMLGGQYRPERMDTVGPIAMSTLEQLRGYTTFLGADGLSMDFGLSAADIDSAHLYRLAVAHARETILVVDHSKFQQASLFKIVDWDKITRVVTDAMPDAVWSEFLHSRGIEVILPDAAQEMHSSVNHSSESEPAENHTTASAL